MYQPNIISMTTPRHIGRDSIEIASGRFAKMPGKYRISKDKLQHHLTHGSYSIMTAANPNAKALRPEENKKRNAELENDLKSLGAIYHDATGVYGGNPEPSLMIHHRGNVTPEALEELGRKYGQESVFHSTDNNHKLMHVTGANAGMHYKGAGHTFGDHFDDNYTDIPEAGKFQGNLDWDKMHKSARKLDHFIVHTEDGKMKVNHHLSYDKLHK